MASDAAQEKEQIKWNGTYLYLIRMKNLNIKTPLET